MKRTAEIKKLSYDVVVIGGGLSGVCAAISSARGGARTAIIQARPVFGGNASSEVRMHVCGASCHVRKPDLTETGILHELQLENKSRNPNFSFPLWDVVLWSKIYTQKNLDFYLNTTMDDVNMDGDRIQSVICRQATTESVYEISAKIFIDASGNSSLGFFSGAEYRMGSEARAEFNEAHAPEEADHYTLGNTIMFISKDVGESSPFKKQDWAYTFDEDDLDQRAHGNTTIRRGVEGNESEYVVEEYAVDSGYWWIELGGETGKIIEETENINAELYKSLFGVWDHIKNRGDHGADNYALDWVGAVPGTRESRRLVGDYILNENDIYANKQFDDAVAYGAWPMDIHPPEGLFAKGVIPAVHLSFSGAYTIPYRCYYSKNVSNLMMAGRNISATRMAFGSIRVMGTCAIGGQAVGTAAAIAVKHDCMPRDVGEKYIKDLQQALLKDDCYIPNVKNQDELDLALCADISASSSLAGFEANKVVSGVSRAVGDESNCWESDGISPDGEKISLKLKEPAKVSQVRITFDSNLNEEIMISMTKRVQQKQVKHMPLELVKDFKIKVFNNGKLQFEKTVSDNIDRLSVNDIPEGVMADEIAVEINSTYGYKNARIFEVRVY